MRKYLYLSYDVLSIATALLLALYLRHGFPLIPEGDPYDLWRLLGLTAVASIVILPVMRTHSSMWRFTSVSELANIMVAVALIVLVSNSGLFLLDRLEMMPRSVPLMHWAMAVMAMGGSRILARRFFGVVVRPSRRKMVKQHVLVVGACHTAELYLQFVKRILQHPVVVEGFLDSDKSLTNWLFHKYKVLGTPEELPRILERLRVHGIHIHQVVMARRLTSLSPRAQKKLVELEQQGVIELVHFAQHINPQLASGAHTDVPSHYQTAGFTPRRGIAPKGLYPYVKRAMDIVLAAVLLVLTLPLLVLVGLLVLLDVGTPLLFWQQRPGLFGESFRLYKFRTMRESGRKFDQDRKAHKMYDRRRMSAVGRWIRRLRLDELPQLFNILGGAMSFVGPRPLLPEDQPKQGMARLSVRPGITGWAQIHGGDALTPEEKLVLDVWYIRHLSLWLDLKIIFQTFWVVWKEDKPSKQAIEQARKQVEEN